MYSFKVPEDKKINIIIDSDAKNEADDQYAIVHALLSPKLNVKGIIGTQFSKRRTLTSMIESYEECKKLVSLMNFSTPVYKGNVEALDSLEHYEVSEGSKFIIEEAKKAEGELYIACMGALTNIAVAVLHEPSIADKISIVWVGGRLNVSDDKGYEANARNDYKAVNVVMERCSKILHIPYETYTMMQVSIAELELRVKPYHEIGEYLFNQLNDFNYNINRPWTNGESWNMGDTTSISVLINKHSATYAKRNAFILDKELNVTEIDKEITAVTSIDIRYAMEDFYAKLVLFSRHQKQTLF